MSRYSRSVIPGRAAGDEGGGDLDRVIFGSKKKAGPVPANDANDDPDFLPPVEDDEVEHLVERSSADRRSGDRRGKASERRAASSRRKSEYKPLKEEGYRSEDSKRGPILLVGALLIVGVFSFVVWNAYREGVKTEGDTSAAPPQLAAAGAFKTPPRAVADVPVVKEAAPAEVLEQLEGSPALAKSAPEVRPDPAPAKVVTPPVQRAAAAPAPSKVTAPPPAALKAPAPQIAVAKPAPAKPVLTTPTPAQTVKAATPPPAAAPVAAAAGNWVAQIAAASSEAGAISEWDKRAKASPELFSTAQRFVVQADVNGKTVYRLRAGPFASKADADAFCTAFKAKGGNCFPAAK